MLLISLYVSNLCLFKERKNLTLKTCTPDFSARSMTKLYAKIKGARAISLFDFPKTWQVWHLVTKQQNNIVKHNSSYTITWSPNSSLGYVLAC